MTLSHNIPDDIIEELKELEDYSFDCSASYRTSYDSWHVPGVHMSIEDSEVMARVSPSELSLHLEQEFATVRHLLKLDPSSRLFFRAFAFYRLPRSGAVVTIFENLGKNALTKFGPRRDSVFPDNTVANGALSDPTNSESEVMTLSQFLDFAIGACECLELLHMSHNIIHGEIRCDSFFFNDETHRVKITNFGYSTRGIKHDIGGDQLIRSLKDSSLDEKLVYMSPEQTGRTSETIDHRTDIYSLGIVFFILLTGNMPFSGSSSMELLNSVLHKPVPSLELIRPDVPSVINKIINKMTSKDVTGRYISAAGLRYDFTEIQKRLRDNASLDDFKLAQHDMSTMFMLPTELVGRDAEMESIIEIVRKFAKAKSQYLSYMSARRNSTLGDPTFSDTRYNSALSSNSESYGMYRTSSAATVSRSSHSHSNGSDYSGSYPDNTDEPQGEPSSLKVSSAEYSMRQPSGMRHKKLVTEVVAMRGGPRVGKTSFVTSARATIRKYCYYSKYSCKPNNVIPLESFVATLSTILKQILAEDEKVLNLVSYSLKSRLINQHQEINILTQHVPELKLLLELQSPRPTKFAGGLEEYPIEETFPRSVQDIQIDVTTDGASTTDFGSMKSSGGSGSTGRIPDMLSADYNAFYNRAQDVAIKNSSGRRMQTTSAILTIFRVLSELFSLCICIGDLQHADDETVDLILSLIYGKVNMIVLMTYNEDAPLAPRLREFLNSGYSRLSHIVLKPLNRAAIEKYSAAVLHREISELQDLVDFLQERTQGVPYYLVELFNLLHSKGAIRFSHRQNQWVYDKIEKLNSIYALFIKDSTDVDVAFVLRRLKDLPKYTRHFLLWASFLGSPFKFGVVRHYMQTADALSSSDSSDSNDTAREDATFIDSDDKALSSLQTLLETGIVVPAGDHMFRFVHHRYETAAINLVRPESLPSMHLLIAETRMKENDDAALICSHLLQAMALIRDKPYRKRYRQHFLTAASRAFDSGSYAKARCLYEAGIELLEQLSSNGVSDSDADEQFAFFYGLAEVFMWEGETRRALDILNRIESDCNSVTAKGKCLFLKSEASFLTADYTNVLNYVQEYAEISSSPILTSALSISEFNLKNKFWTTIKEISDMSPESTSFSANEGDVEVNIIMEKLLVNAAEYAYLDGSEKFLRLALAVYIFETTVYTGECLSLAYLFMAMACISSFDMLDFASNCKDIALQLLNKCENQSVVARGRLFCYTYMDHFFTVDSKTFEDISLAINSSISSGDRSTMLQLVAFQLKLKFFYSDSLADVVASAEEASEQINDIYQYSDPATIIMSMRQCAKALMGRTNTENCEYVLTDDTHDSLAFRRHLIGRSTTSSVLSYSQFFMFTLYVFGHYDKIFMLSELFWQPRERFINTRSCHMCKAWVSLSCIELIKRNQIDQADREILLAKVRDQQLTLKRYSEASKSNYYLIWAILEMQLLDLQGSFEGALKQYNEIEEYCEKLDYVFELTIARWICTDILVRKGLHVLAKDILKKVHQRFLDIGAFGLIRELNRRFPDLQAVKNSNRYVDAEIQTSSVHKASAVSVLNDIDDKVGVEIQKPKELIHHHADQFTIESKDQDFSSKAMNENEAWTLDAAERANSATLDIIDFQSIIKSSQIISSEINISTLMSRMIDIFISTTRAELVAIVHIEDSRPYIAAFGNTETVETFSVPKRSIESMKDILLTNAISYVLKTEETLFIRDSLDDDQFSRSTGKWMANHPEGRAVFVHPVQHKGKLIGALYLEGATNSFNARHMEVIGLMVQQMGISITNAILFQNFQKVTMANAAMIENQKLSLKAVRESEAKFVATLESMPCIIWTSDPPTNGQQQTLQYLNNFWYKYCGSNAPGASDAKYLDQFHPDERAKFLNELQHACTTGVYASFEIRLRDAAGDYRWHMSRATPLKNGDGKITQWIGALIDIDDQRQAREEALQAMRMKEEASKMKSEFLANMSHEIRTPIAGVIGMSDLLLSTELLPEQRSFAENVRLCADALLTVITDVLDFSKIEAGKLELSNVPFDVTQTLKDTLSILSFMAAKKGLRLLDDIYFSKCLPLVMGDPGRFRQIVMNLLTNAVKFTHVGNIILTARDGYETDDIIEVKLTIRDTGIGIGKTVISKLFLPFEQGDNSTARKFGGTGLGLSISKNLVELMNGSIWLESEVGKGTVAHIAIPFVKSTLKLSSSLSSPSTGSVDESYDILLSPRTPLYMQDHTMAMTQSIQSTSSRWSRATSQYPSSPSLSVKSSITSFTDESPKSKTPEETLILVVEDNLINQQIALSMLKKMKYNTDAVVNGQEALAVLTKKLEIGQPVDLVLMDCQMPIMDGYEATRQVRLHDDPRIRDVPIIGLTANAVSGDREKCLEAGMSDYLAKPVKSKILASIIERWLYSTKDE
ncbi:hypothetical protein V1511DRAFT_126956 [Dipodascopsis uninucleata]